MFFNKKKNKSCCTSSAAEAGALTAASLMLVLSLLNSVGLYQNATAEMAKWHMFYTPDVQGTILGMLEAAVVTYVIVTLFLWFQGMFKDKK
ncbi:MAG: hypothetical protein NUV81_00180 [bacterium]|nr:hypothetical protein [bacterium]